MATQGQRRREAVAAVRRFRQLYRTSDSAGERVEREVDRLIKRKTLIGPDSLKTLIDRVTEYGMAITALEKAIVVLGNIIRGIPV